MWKKESILGILAASCIAACVPIGLAALEDDGVGPAVGRHAVEPADGLPASADPSSTATAIAPAHDDPPAAPGFGGEVALRAPTDAPTRTLDLHLFVDRYAHEIVGLDLARELGCTIELESRRNVIEHAITGHATIGITSVPPSAQERRLGARDMILGDFHSVLIVAPHNPVRVLTRPAAHALLAGKADRYWPGTDARVAVFGPYPGHRSDLLAALSIPGDALRVDRGFDCSGARADAARVMFEAVADDPHAIGVTSEAEVRHTAVDVARVAIEGHQPRITLYFVFRDENAPAAATLLAFYRSGEGRAFFDRRLALR